MGGADVTAGLKTRAAERLAEKRVILLDEDEVTHPPSVEDLWRHSWYVLYTLPGQEKQVRKALVEAGYATFLPVATIWNASRFRVKRQLERSLLVRYLFAGVGSAAQRYLSDDDWSKIRNIDGVHAVLGELSGTPIRVPVENLVQLAGEIVAGFYDETRDTFAAGQPVTITGGAFAGFSASVIDPVPKEAAPDDPIAVLMRMMGRDALIHIPLAELRREE